MLVGPSPPRHLDDSDCERFTSFPSAGGIHRGRHTARSTHPLHDEQGTSAMSSWSPWMTRGVNDGTGDTLGASDPPEGTAAAGVPSSLLTRRRPCEHEGAHLLAPQPIYPPPPSAPTQLTFPTQDLCTSAEAEGRTARSVLPVIVVEDFDAGQAPIIDEMCFFDNALGTPALSVSATKAASCHCTPRDLHSRRMLPNEIQRPLSSPPIMAAIGAGLLPPSSNRQPVTAEEILAAYGHPPSHFYGASESEWSASDSVEAHSLLSQVSDIKQDQTSDTQPLAKPWSDGDAVRRFLDQLHVCGHQESHDHRALGNAPQDTPEASEAKIKLAEPERLPWPILRDLRMPGLDVASEVTPLDVNAFFRVTRQMITDGHEWRTLLRWSEERFRRIRAALEEHLRIAHAVVEAMEKRHGDALHPQASEIDELSEGTEDGASWVPRKMRRNRAKKVRQTHVKVQIGEDTIYALNTVLKTLAVLRQLDGY